MKKEKTTNRTEHFYNARKRLVLAGVVTLAVPLTGFGSLIAINGIKDLVKEYKVQKELKQYAESGEACNVSSITEENTSEENQQVEETKEES